MVSTRLKTSIVKLVSGVFFNSVALTVIPDCTETIAFYLRVATAAHVGAEKQSQSLKSAIVYALLVTIVISITLLRFRIRVEPYSLNREKITLCGECWRKGRDREIRKGLLNSERNWLHRFCQGLFPPSKLKTFFFAVIQWKRSLRMISRTLSLQSPH